MASENIFTCRWGVMGLGLIASWFIEDLENAQKRSSKPVNHIVTTVASRSQSRASATLEKLSLAKLPKVVTSYETLAKSNDVDAIYVATPHAMHYEHVRMCLENGKNVLCEKSFTINAAEAESLIKIARKSNVYLMEGMWLRFRPLVLDLQKKIVQEKIIGTPKRLYCDFSMPTDLETVPDDSRFKNIALGAGSLLDLGIYSLTWAKLLLGDHPDNKGSKPTVKADMVIHPCGIDEQTSIILNYPILAASAMLSSSLVAKYPKDFLRLEGSNGAVITINARAPSVPTSYVVTAADGTVTTFHGESVPSCKGFIWEADSFALGLAAGQKENSLMSLSESLEMMEMMDEIRRQGGLAYPQDSNVL